jgi:hypothetical protein
MAKMDPPHEEVKHLEGMGANTSSTPSNPLFGNNLQLAEAASNLEEHLIKRENLARKMSRNIEINSSNLSNFIRINRPLDDDLLGPRRSSNAIRSKSIGDGQKSSFTSRQSSIEDPRSIQLPKRRSKGDKQKNLGKKSLDSTKRDEIPRPIARPPQPNSTSEEGIHRSLKPRPPTKQDEGPQDKELPTALKVPLAPPDPLAPPPPPLPPKSSITCSCSLFPNRKHWNSNEVIGDGMHHDATCDIFKGLQIFVCPPKLSNAAQLVLAQVLSIESESYENVEDSEDCWDSDESLNENPIGGYSHRTSSNYYFIYNKVGLYI